MENASKALLMAAGVFLGIGLLTIMIYLFRAGGKVSEAYDSKQITNQLELYNGQFEFYDTRENTISDVLTLANLVYSVNEDTEYDKGYAVQLDIDIGGKIYSVPSTYKNESTYEKYLPKRNMIWDGANAVSIYDLMNKTIGELNTSANAVVDNTNLENPLKSQITNLSLYTGNTIDTSERLSMTRFSSSGQKTIYKYLFVCDTSDDFQYHDTTGRVKYIKLKLYINPEYPIKK